MGSMDIPSPDALLATMPEIRSATAQRLRALIGRHFPDATEALRPGWRVITYRLPTGRGRATAQFAWVMVEPVHVHLGFTWGVFMDDPEGILEGRELRQVRWVTLTTPDEHADADLLRWLEEAAQLARLGRAGRLAWSFDREPDAAVAPRAR